MPERLIPLDEQLRTLLKVVDGLMPTYRQFAGTMADKSGTRGGEALREAYVNDAWDVEGVIPQARNALERLQKGNAGADDWKFAHMAAAELVKFIQRISSKIPS